MVLYGFMWFLDGFIWFYVVFRLFLYGFMWFLDCFYMVLCGF